MNHHCQCNCNLLVSLEALVPGHGRKGRKNCLLSNYMHVCPCEPGCLSVRDQFFTLKKTDERAESSEKGLKEGRRVIASNLRQEGHYLVTSEK